MRWFNRRPALTPELVDIAKHQVEQQEQLDVLAEMLEREREDIRGLYSDLLARTTRIHSLEIGLRKNNADVTLAAAAISDLLTDLLPFRDARIESALHSIAVLFARMQSAEEALDCLENCDKETAHG